MKKSLSNEQPYIITGILPFSSDVE